MPEGHFEAYRGATTSPSTPTTSSRTTEHVLWATDRTFFESLAKCSYATETLRSILIVL